MSSVRRASTRDWNFEDVLKHSAVIVLKAGQWSKSRVLSLWTKTSRRIRGVGGFIIFTLIALSLWRPDRRYEIPEVTLEYGSKPESLFNASKVALLIENRPLPILAPLMLHFISVVPPDWRFRFMGSIESVARINASRAIREQHKIGKLDLTYIPANMSTAGQEQISRFLTNLWLYEHVLQPAEWLLIFQTDSILCANSKQSLNDWLDYDWVGAPWDPSSRFGGNGGLSLRRVSPIIEILRDQNRLDDTDPEDVWLTERLGHRPGANLANGTASLTFSAEINIGKPEKVNHQKGKNEQNEIPTRKPAEEGIDSTPQDEGWEEGIDDWRDGFYEPMGYHTGDNGNILHPGIWGTPELRKHIWDYCPEVKIIFNMDATEYVPGECNSHWKRGKESVARGTSYGIDMTRERDLEYGESGYIYLSAGLVPWP